jgi:phosphohistidine phosphatase
MVLYLVQHAEAKQKEEDPARDLTERGRRDLEKVAGFLGKLNLPLAKIFHSGKTRALSTANILAASLNPAKGVVEITGLAPLDSPEDWADRLETMNEDIMLVGHLPHLAKLAARLLCSDEEKNLLNFQMAGVVSLRPDESWQWAVDWMLIPELIP